MEMMRLNPLDLVKIEGFKLLRKRESYLLFTMWLIPLFYGWGFVTKNDGFIYKGTGLIGCLDWLQVMFAMLYQVFIFYVFVAIVAARSLGGEVDEHSILLYVPRINSRMRLYFAKAAAVTLLVTAALVGFVLVSIGTYYALMVRVPGLASGAFWHSSDSLAMGLFGLEVYLTFVIVGFATLLLGLYLKPLLCVAVTTVLMVVLLYVSQIGPVAYGTPWFYMVRTFDEILHSSVSSSVGNLRLQLFTTAPVETFGLFVGISAVWCSALYVAGVVKFKGRDL